MALSIQQIITRCLVAFALSVSLASCETTALEQPLLGGNAVADSALANDVRAALKKNPQTTRLRIKVSSIEDVIVLRGSVGNDQESETAEQVAGKVSGVRHVTNHLCVGY